MALHKLESNVGGKQAKREAASAAAGAAPAMGC